MEKRGIAVCVEEEDESSFCSVPFCSILFRDKFRAPKLNLPKFAHCEGVCIRVHICAGVG